MRAWGQGHEEGHEAVGHEGGDRRAHACMPWTTLVPTCPRILLMVSHSQVGPINGCAIS
jgi:hypothetical protein